MPCLSLPYQPDIGPLIPLLVSTPDVEMNESSPIFHALIDTGASITCITPKLATIIGASAIGMRQMHGVTGIHPARTYLLDIGFVFDHGALFRQSRCEVVEFTLEDDSPFHILLGRDLLARGHFSLSLDHRFVFCL